MPFRLGPMELIIIMVIVMMIFGGGRLPQVGSALGSAIKEFRKGQASDDDASEPGVAEATDHKDEIKKEEV